MTDTRTKIRGLFLAAIMVLSVFGGTMAFAGTAVANAPGQGSYSAGNAPTDETASQPVTQGSNVEIAEFDFTGDQGNVTQVDVDPGYGIAQVGISPSDVGWLRVHVGLDDGTTVSVTNNSFSSFPATFNFSGTSAATGDQVVSLRVVASVTGSASDGDEFDAGVEIFDDDGTSLSGATSPYDTQNTQLVTSDTGFISGTLTDGGTGDSLPGETVQVYRDSGTTPNEVDDNDVLVKNTTTNTNGIYTVELAPQNVSDSDAGYVLLVDKNGFETFSSDALSVSAGDTTTQNIVLKPLGTPTDIRVIATDPASNSVVADGSETITHYVQVIGTLGTQTDVPLNGTDVDAAGDSGIFNLLTTTPNTTEGEVTLPNGTTVNGVTTFTVSSTVVNTAILNYSVTSNSSIFTTYPADFRGESGEGNLHGNLLDISRSEGLENGSVWVVRADDWETNSEETDFWFGISPDEPGDPANDNTYWVRLVDAETGEIIDNDDYDLRIDESDTGTHVRKIDALNESDSSVGEGYAVIDSDDGGLASILHTRLEPRDYYIQVSANASNADTVDSLTDGTPENFQNVTSLSGNDVDGVGTGPAVIFSPTENLTMAAAIETSEDTGANLVDSPGFVNSFGQDTGGTDADGNYVLSKIPTDFQSGIQYVAIGTKAGYTTDFADVYLTEDGQLIFSEQQNSNDLFVYPQDIDPVVNVTNIALLSSTADAPSDPADPSAYDSYAYDNQTDEFSQVVPRDGAAVDVVLLETTAEEDGTPIDHTVVLSVPDREEDANDEARDFNGSWIAVAGGTVVSQDPANDTITVATGSDGEAIVWLQSDRSTATLNSVYDGFDANACGVEEGFSGIYAASTTDEGAIDSTCKVFSGITEFGSISGIVTDENNNPIANADVWVDAFELDANDVQVEITPINGTHANVSVYDDTGADAGDLTARGSFVAGADVSFNDLREYRFQDFNSSVRQTYGLLPPSPTDGFTLYRVSGDEAGFLGKYTLAKVPAKSDNNEYSVTALSPVLGLTGSGDAQTRTGVTDDANIVIIGAQEPEYQVSNLNAPANASQGETITVTADITNNGTVADQAVVDFQFNGTVVDTVTTEPLSAAETVTVEFQVDTSGIAPGTYTHGVSTADDDATATITITGSESVSTTDLLDAIDDWRSGDMSTTDLLDMIDAWRNN